MGPSVKSGRAVPGGQAFHTQRSAGRKKFPRILLARFSVVDKPSPAPFSSFVFPSTVPAAEQNPCLKERQDLADCVGSQEDAF